jgi:recombinational DNA repair protein RecR
MKEEIIKEEIREIVLAINQMSLEHSEESMQYLAQLLRELITKLSQ